MVDYTESWEDLIKAAFTNHMVSAITKFANMYVRKIKTDSCLTGFIAVYLRAHLSNINEKYISAIFGNEPVFKGFKVVYSQSYLYDIKKNILWDICLYIL